MKTLSIVGFNIIFLFAIACGSSSQSVATEYTGTIEPAGITSYQYGTHRLITDDETYALKSEKVDLNKYEGKKVTLTAEKVEGYPVDGGPIFLNVMTIKE
ncbi:hypothetical protein C7S20_04885 [Christiangramia fulva]|uniref:Uncharacterized protein n=1 Tax=Christiangramia fulva TaxID=2126553 RepID=A0A2R3Z333_9FLAO|nr:hypothetical protein [Christiangramia fulva]AVR44649.1 hypothetical protein C7S20_04885 [Christiangramia fulva]